VWPSASAAQWTRPRSLEESISATGGPAGWRREDQRNKGKQPRWTSSRLRVAHAPHMNRAAQDQAQPTPSTVTRIRNILGHHPRACPSACPSLVLGAFVSDPAAPNAFGWPPMGSAAAVASPVRSRLKGARQTTDGKDGGHQRRVRRETAGEALYTKGTSAVQFRGRSRLPADGTRTPDRGRDPNNWKGVRHRCSAAGCPAATAERRSTAPAADCWRGSEAECAFRS